MALRRIGSSFRAITLTLFILGAGTTSCAGDPREARELRAGDRAPEQWSTKRKLVLWVLQPKDLLACRTAGNALRRIQRIHTEVELGVLAVNVDTGWVRSFIREERISAFVERTTRDEYQDSFGKISSPRILVIGDGKVVDVIVPEVQISEVEKTRRAIEAALASII